MKLKRKFHIPGKDFNKKESSYKELTITINDINSHGEILFSIDLPLHVYDKLKNSSKDFTTKEKGGKFKRKISASSYKMLCDHYQSLCSESQDIENTKELNKEKKIFIKFYASNNKTRDQWCGAYTGKESVLKFKFFIGYKSSVIRGKMLSDKEEEFVKYYSKHYSPTDYYNGYKADTLQPLNMDWEHKKIEAEFTIVDWTQEREDFLIEIEKRFVLLGENLNSFLGDLDSNKLDILIENKQFLIN